MHKASCVPLLFQVTLIGLVKSVNESPTRIDYVIDDMTGPPLDVRRFNDSDVSQFCVRWNTKAAMTTTVLEYWPGY